jgi:hypothetical protein
MAKRVLFLVSVLLLVLVLPVSAHEDRPVGEFEIEFGWQREPIFVGMMNGPELYIFVKAEGDDHAADDMAMLEISGEAGVPEITLEVAAAEEGGLMVTYDVSNFTFSTEHANSDHVEGEGHAHVLVDGVEKAMVFGDPVLLPDVMPGEHEVSISLNANSHETLTYNGEVIGSSVMFTLEGDPEMDDMVGKNDHAHDAATDDDHDMAGEDDHSHEAAMVDEHTHGDGLTPVTDADLQVEITFGPASKTLTLLPVPGDPGHYVADLIPTRPGDYTFRLFGTANGVAIDEVFTSADGQFDTVEPAADILFPDDLPATVELLDRIEQLEARLETLEAGG